ncbi:MAG: FAD-dependent oxidoreductase [Candidatus Wallbacteria bacterium]
MADKVDVIVVGAGPAGTACALTLAKAGLEVAVFERGEYPGAKNVMGGILFTNSLMKLIPDFKEKAPVERPVSKRKFLALNSKDALGVEFSYDDFTRPPYNNNFTVLRAKFDQWFAAQAEEAGAMFLNETVVDDFIYENGKIAGVKSRREDGDLLANCVILADGANSLLARKAGMRSDFHPSDYVLGVKMVLGLPKEKIEDRFNLNSDNEGAAYEYFGGVTNNLMGSGFIYTNKESLSVGLGVSLEMLGKLKIKPYDLLDKFMDHPHIKKLVQGAEPLEYAAHLLPEGGYRKVPPLFNDHILICGDAASLVNTSLYHEGSNLAMESGVMAAKTVIQAKGRGDYSAKSLMKYGELLNETFVMPDMKKYRKLPALMHSCPQFFKEYMDLPIDVIREYFTVDEHPKSFHQKEIFKKVWNRVSLPQLFKDGFNAFRAFIWS